MEPKIILRNKKGGKKKTAVDNGDGRKLFIISVAVVIFAVLSAANYYDETLATVKLLIKNLMRIRAPSRMAELEMVVSHEESIKTLKYRYGGRFIRSIASEAVPALVRDSPSSNWPFIALNMYDVAVSATANLSDTRIQPKATFTAFNDREKGGMLGSRDKVQVIANVSLIDFVRSDADSKSYMDWKGELEYWDTYIYANSTGTTTYSGKTFHGWERFKLVEKSLEEIFDEDDDEVWRPTMRLTQSKVVTQTRFDPKHQFVVQAQGQQVFHLFQPSTELYVFPSIHKAYHQSQIYFESSLETEAYPLARGSNVTQVVLMSGDVLYIPPYWFYRTHCLKLCLTLTVASPSHIEIALADAFWAKVPFGRFVNTTLTNNENNSTADFEDIGPENVTEVINDLTIESDGAAGSAASTSPTQQRQQETSETQESSSDSVAAVVDPASGRRDLSRKVAAAGEYLRLVLSLALAAGTNNTKPSANVLRELVTEFSKDLYHRRFEPLYSLSELARIKQEYANSPTSQAWITEVSETGVGMIGEPDSVCSYDGNTKTLVDTEDKFGPAASKISDSILAATTAPAAGGRALALDSIRRSFLRDYVEQIVRWAVGPDLTALYVLECLGEFNDFPVGKS